MAAADADLITDATMEKSRFVAKAANLLFLSQNIDFALPLIIYANFCLLAVCLWPEAAGQVLN